MIHYSKEDIQDAEFKFRLHLINSISGLKPANLIGTRSNEGKENLAIFSSVVHLGSDPGLIGFVLRPDSEVPRHTYENIQANGTYTINHIHKSFVEKAHYTSAKFDRGVSEFEACQLSTEYLEGFEAPYVAESKIKYGLKMIDELEIKANGTKLIVGELTHLYVDENAIDSQGMLSLDTVNDVGISGLNQYYSISKFKKIPYARVSELPNFEKKPDPVVFDEETQTYNANVLPYGTSIGAPSITSTEVSSWKSSSINTFNHSFNNKIEALKENYEKLIDEYQTNEMMYGVKLNFEPIIGNVYHLYKNDNEDEKFLSLIPPGSWNKEFLGSYKLNHEKVWERITV